MQVKAIHQIIRRVNGKQKIEAPGSVFECDGTELEELKAAGAVSIDKGEIKAAQVQAAVEAATDTKTETKAKTKAVKETASSEPATSEPATGSTGEGDDTGADLL